MVYKILQRLTLKAIKTYNCKSKETNINLTSDNIALNYLDYSVAIGTVKRDALTVLSYTILSKNVQMEVMIE